jgi:isochorismate hydrolase
MSENKTYPETFGELKSSIKEELNEELKTYATDKEKTSLDDFSEEKLQAALKYVEKHRPNVYTPSDIDVKEFQPSLDELKVRFRTLVAKFEDEKQILRLIDIQNIYARETVERLCSILETELNQPIKDLNEYFHNREEMIKKLEIPDSPKEVRKLLNRGWSVIVDRYKSEDHNPIGQLIKEEEKKEDSNG